MMSDQSPAADKVSLRATARLRRREFVTALDPFAHRFAFKAMPSPLARGLADAQVVALYMGLDDEAPAQRLAPQLLAMGKVVALPRVRDRLGGMDFLAWNCDDTLVPGLYGTSHPGAASAPVSPDAIMAPLVAFDRAMNRLGQGGGYYDRAFARFPNALRIGMGWSVQELEAVPADPWDLPLHMILTEVEMIKGTEA